MKLKLSDYSSLADIIAAIAIVISLIYVGIQISDNTRATRSANANAATSITMAAYAAVTSSTESSSVWFRGMSDPQSLTDAERVQFLLMAHTYFLAFQNSFYLSMEGTLDKEMREVITNAILATKDTPGVHFYWSVRRQLFTQEFREWVDAILSDDAPFGATDIYGTQKSEESK